MNDPLLEMQREIIALKRQLAMFTSGAYATMQFVPLTTSLSSTSWDGDPYSTVGSSGVNSQLDLSAVFGTPANIKAVLMRVAVNDSAAWGTAGLYAIFYPSSSTIVPSGGVRCFGGDIVNEGVLVLPCDASGDVFYRLGASGSGTLDVDIKIWGYWI
jgi:hypothetical protein